MRRKFRESLRSGEAFALKQMPAADIMGLLFADPIPPNEKIDGGIVVHIRGPLEHHLSDCGDSYEAISARICDALESTTGCVILKIDSPGGLVSGLNETVYAMQEKVRESGVDVVTFVGELAASAAYAMACIAGEIVTPRTGICGSVGVISAMTSVSRANEKAGIDVVTITSGERKADGHPDVPINDEAIEAEQGRVDRLAGGFFELVEEARGVDASKFEAGLFLGPEAVKAGLADRVSSWTELLVDVAEDYGSGDTVAQNGTPPSSATEVRPMNLNALISRAEKALAAEKDPKKRAALASDIAMFRGALQAGTKKTYKKMEEQRTEESDDAEEEAEGNETDREEADETPKKDDSKKESKKKASASRAESEEEEARSAESEDEEESAESEEEEASAEDDKDDKEASALLKSPGRAAAILTKARAYDALQNKVAKLEARSIKQEREAIIKNAKLPPSIARRLASKPLAYVKDFIKDMRGTALASLGTEEDSLIPNNYEGRGEGTEGFSERQLQIFRTAAAQMNRPLEDVIKDYRMSTTRPNGQRSANVITKDFVNGHRTQQGGN